MYRENYYYFFFLCSFRNGETPGWNRRKREYLRDKGYGYFQFCFSVVNSIKINRENVKFPQNL